MPRLMSVALTEDSRRERRSGGGNVIEIGGHRG